MSALPVSPPLPSFPRRNKDPAYLQRSVWKGGSDERYSSNWGNMWDKSTHTDTNPMGVIVPGELKKEIRLYADLNQVTKDVYSKQDNTGPNEGLPTILDPNKLLNRPDTPMWLIPKDSGVYDYTIPDDDIFYIMATSGIYANQSDAFDDLTTNWIGYVAISNGDHEGKNRDIAIVFRGTVEESEWWSDFQPEMVRWNDLQAGEPGRLMLFGYGLPLLKRFTPQQTDSVMVAKGFEQMYRHFTSTPGNSISVQGQVHVALHKLLAAYPGKVGSITTTGHSLGGALASMCAFDIATSRINRDGDGEPVIDDRHKLELGYNPNAYIPVTAITFEAPRVGNENYAKCFDAPKPDSGPDALADWADLKMLRIVNKPDIVPTKPDISIVDRLFDPLRWGQLVVYLVYKGALLVFFHKYWEITNIYHHGGVEYQVNSLPLEGKGKPLPMLSGLDEVFQHHNMQLAVHLCDPSGRGPFTPCDLKGAKDGPECKMAASAQNGAAPAH